MVSHGSDASRDVNSPPLVMLARLLTELAGLPPEQRAAIAALLSPAAATVTVTVTVTLPTTTPVVTGHGEPDRLHRDYEGGNR